MLKLDQYTLIRFLGKGTFGEVYLTQKEGSNNYYATKRMEKKLVDDPRYNKYFKNEISILHKLFHENIIRLEELKITANHYYIIMEYCNGGSLNQCLNRYKEMYHRPFTEEIVQYIMRQVISAVKYIHSQRIIHRDLKLDNILVNFLNPNDYNAVDMLKTRVKIIDFGFASSKDENEMYTTAIGSPLNMDPLILKKFNAGRVQTNDLYYDEKADIWSLGALCYQMLIGNSPFDAYNMQELVAKIEEGTYKVPTNLSREVVSFLNGMLQYDPNKRLTAENLSNHAFLTKNVADFTQINTNMISRNVYGGQLNINIKNNQSIWAIFNEADQNTLNSIPMDIYSADKPLSESRYIPTSDNFIGITPEPHNELSEYFDSTKSIPIFQTNSQEKSISSISTSNSGGLYPHQSNMQNKSEGAFQNPQPPQNQYYQNMGNNINPVPNMNNNMQNPPQQKMQSQIITFGNQIFNYEQQDSFGNKKAMDQPQNQINNPNRNINGEDLRIMHSPTVKNNVNNINNINNVPYNNRMVMNQEGNYPINNNPNIINRGKMVDRTPNMQMNRPMPNNQLQNQIRNQPQYPMRQIQVPQRQPVQNPGMNIAFGSKPTNVNTKQMNQMNQYAPKPGQLNIIQRQPNLTPNLKMQQQPNLYSKITVPNNINQNIPSAKKAMIPPNNARTPTKGLINKNGGGPSSQSKKNIIKIVRPRMFMENPNQIQRINSTNNLIRNPQYVNRAPIQNSPQQKVQMIQQGNITEKKIVGRIMQRPMPQGVAQNLMYKMTPQKPPNMNNIRTNPHFVYGQNNLF